MEKEKINKDFNEIILHCTATPELKEFDIEDIRRWHKEEGFSDVGYHYGVLLDGTIQKGRPLEIMGSHCKDARKNHTSVGIFYIGGCAKDGITPKDTRTEEQKKSLNKLLRNLLEIYPQLKKVSGHNQYANKACPSFDVRKEYKYLTKYYDIEV